MLSKRLMPAQIILLGFLLLILVGTMLLMLPAASADSNPAPFLSALFTATSATCVTGLVVVDTATHWSVFGQAVILVLIQIGGMGVVTMALAVSLVTGRRIGFSERRVMQESIGAPQLGGIIRMTGFIVRGVLLFEMIGAILLTIRFAALEGVSLGQAAWYGVFHSISAFCNAGFDLFGTAEAPFASLTGFMGDAVVNTVVMLLIIIGGLGFFVWEDIRINRLHFKRYRLHTKIVLGVTAVLLVLPALFFYFFEFARHEWAHLSAAERALASIFQSVSPRTAGFNTVDLTALSAASVLVMIPLMLVGGSPGSTAGGAKTTTLAVCLLAVRSVFARKDSIQCFRRRLPSDAVKNAIAIMSMYLLLFFAVSVCLCCLDDVSLRDAMFEAASAIGTVGLSMGITASLCTFSKVVLILLMFFGRVGALTLLYAVAGEQMHVPSSFPQEKIPIG